MCAEDGRCEHTVRRRPSSGQRARLQEKPFPDFDLDFHLQNCEQMNVYFFKAPPQSVWYVIMEALVN